MQELNYDWFTELGLNKDDFSNLPKDENPLVWGLRNDIVKEEAYTLWASSRYQIPAIKPEFFSLAIDFTLLEKFSDLYQWSEACYPIYLWEDTLFVACLEPIEISTPQKMCFVASPFSAMEMAWNNHTKNVPEILTKSAINLPDLDLKIDLPEAKEEIIKDVEPSGSIESVDSQADSSTPATPSVGDLDFSNLTAEEDNTQIDVKNAPLENTVPDQKINNLTTATETIHIKAEESELKNLPLPDMDFKEISTDNISLEGDKNTETEVQQPTIQTEQNSIIEQTAIDLQKEDSHIPTLTDLVPDKANSTEEIPQLETNSQINNNPNPPTLEKQLFDDDYTPLPFMKKEDGPSNTLITFQATDPGSPLPSTIPTPPNNNITDSDLSTFSDLATATETKSVMSHIFYHLKNDYKKLAWANNIDSKFYPKYAWGPWAIKPQTWHEEIDLVHPNIFRIAFRSGLPFHGKVQENPFNDKIFDRWNDGQLPSFVTVFPVVIENHTYGFIIGFSQGALFDSVQSLRKIENLVSIVKPTFLKFQSKKVS